MFFFVRIISDRDWVLNSFCVWLQILLHIHSTIMQSFIYQHIRLIIFIIIFAGVAADYTGYR